MGTPWPRGPGLRDLESIFLLAFQRSIESAILKYILWHRLGVVQFHSILTLATQSYHRTLQVKGKFPTRPPFFRWQLRLESQSSPDFCPTWLQIWGSHHLPPHNCWFTRRTHKTRESAIPTIIVLFYRIQTNARWRDAQGKVLGGQHGLPCPFLGFRRATLPEPTRKLPYISVFQIFIWCFIT